MSELVKSQIVDAQREVAQITGKDITEDRAFSHVLLKNVFSVDYVDQIDLVTDGANDGGIDFLYYDEEEAKVVLCQAKYTGDLSFDQVILELEKMYSTVQNFKRAHTGSYNDRVKKALQNALDRLPEDSQDSIEYNVFTTADIDIKGLERKINNTQHDFPTDAVTIFTADEIEKAIQRQQETIKTVKYEKIKIDQANNYLEYESNDLQGIMCNVLSTSIVQLYNKYAGEGLFDLNIRRYIRSTLVDNGINKTLDSDRENFWFLNNGIIIACTEYEVDGNTVKLSEFSIVNGGQTTTLISTYKGTNSQAFYIPCKIVATKRDDEADSFYTKIAEATNSQKPIYPRDLKSNSPEMISLQRMLKQNGVYLEIKRGYKPKWTYKTSIKNDELGQLILSFALQQPGTSRSGKKKIFDTPSTYDRIFKGNYDRDPGKKAFVIDIVDLADRYNLIEKEFKAANSGLTLEQIEIFKNGKQMIFALMGLCYRLVNDDVSIKNLLDTPRSVANIPFVYAGNISNYRKDDIDKKLKTLVRSIVRIVANNYKNAYKSGQVTSVSNFLKTDQKYYTEIVPEFAQSFDMLIGEDLRSSMDILKRG